MAESAPRQSDHSHCSNCVKIKEERCLETKLALEKCAHAQEEARAAKESFLAEQLKEAKAKNQSMQKTLMAFQIATTVGVTILGQETFDKITGKVDEVKHVQEKITGTSTDEHKDEKPGDKKSSSKSVSMDSNTFGLFPHNKGVDYRGIHFFENLVITTDTPERQNTPWIPQQTAVSLVEPKTQVIVDPPVVTPPSIFSATNYDFLTATTNIPELLNYIQYPLLPFQDSPFVYGQQSNIPECKYIGSTTLLSVAAYITPRRRNV